LGEDHNLAAPIIRVRMTFDDALIFEIIDELLNRLLAQAHALNQHPLPCSLAIEIGNDAGARFGVPMMP
jgi:hypothetical protein